MLDSGHRNQVDDFLDAVEEKSHEDGDPEDRQDFSYTPHSLTMDSFDVVGDNNAPFTPTRR